MQIEKGVVATFFFGGGGGAENQYVDTYLSLCDTVLARLLHIVLGNVLVTF